MVLAIINVKAKEDRSAASSMYYKSSLTVYRVKNVVIDYPGMCIVGRDNIDHFITSYVIVCKYF